MRFQLVLVKPDNFDFVEGFREPIEVLQESLAALGHIARVQINRIDTDAVPIIFGAHHIAPEDVSQLPANSIIFNLEQLAPGYPWFTEPYLQLLRRFQVWDFSAHNVDYLHGSGIAPSALHVPFGYSPCLSRIDAAATEDVDVLFFGVQSERRLSVLRELGERGAKVVGLNNVWGAERDGWIARAKVVLNTHQADGGQFEIVRVLFLLANGKAVVSEVNPGEEIDQRLRGRFVATPYDRLVAACLHLVEADEERAALAKAAAGVAQDEDLRALPGIAHAVAVLSAAAGGETGFRRHLETLLTGRSSHYANFSANKPLDIPLERIAFYLPQFHRCDENDAFWGKGFTEWSLVTRGLPKFEGHILPRLPGDLGYYDLAKPGTIEQQVALARNYGLTGFMFFFYSFGGKTVLETPLRYFLDHPEIDFKFFLMWANENWTSRWDGQEEEVLLRQDYSDAGARALAEQMLPYFLDHRYIRCGNRPVLVIYRPDLIPDIDAYRQHLAIACAAHGMGAPYLVMALVGTNTDPRTYGFDAALEYPPHQFQSSFGRPGAPTDIAQRLTLFDPGFSGAVLNYEQMVDSWCAPFDRPFRVLRTAFPSWDNVARRRNGGSWTFTGASPAAFERWMRHIRDQEMKQVDGLHMICINAWNEWSEGAFLEPDSYDGYAYLDALYRGLSHDTGYPPYPASKTDGMR